MTVTELLDQVIGRGDNVPAADADISDRRTRILEFLVTVFAYVWFYRGWGFRLRTASVTAGQVQVVDPYAAAAFGDIPSEGGIYLVSNNARLEYANPAEVALAQNMVPAVTTTTPSTYSLFYNATTGTMLQLPTQAAVGLLVVYGAAPPTLDETSASDTGANNTNLAAMPVRWHQLVLVPGVRAMSRLSLGDATAAPAFTMDPVFREGLRMMVAAERPSRDTTRRLPGFFGRG